MSDQYETGAIVSLEDVFQSRDFGRRPPRRDASIAATVEPSDPPQLEQVFLSEFFGHPEAITARTASAATVTAPTAPPTLVILTGRGDAERDFMRYRGAIGAASGVAAAALVVAGVASTGRLSQAPTVSAQGQHPGHSSRPPGGGSQPGPGGVTTQPSTSGPGTSPTTQPVSGSGPIPAQLASVTPPTTAAVTVAVPPSSPVGVVPPPPPPGGGTAPSPPGGGNVLTPVLNTVGNTVSTVGTTVTAASNGLGQALPALSPVTGLVGNVGSTVATLGQSITEV